MADAAIAPNQPGGRRQRGPLNSALTGYLLAGLALLAMIAIFVYPLGYSFVTSFFRWDLSAPRLLSSASTITRRLSQARASNNRCATSSFSLPRP
jgi:multiple sugar transport system permease protein